MRQSKALLKMSPTVNINNVLLQSTPDINHSLFEFICLTCYCSLQKWKQDYKKVKDLKSKYTLTYLFYEESKC